MILRAPTDGRIFGLDRVEWMMLLGGAVLAGFMTLVL
jgi:hypothetical protein